jgi:hypothetical protein
MFPGCGILSDSLCVFLLKCARMVYLSFVVHK